MNTSVETRQELLAALAKLGRIRPQWRLGQTLANVAMTAGRLESSGVWDLEDEEALAAAKALIEQYAESIPADADVGANSGYIVTSSEPAACEPPRQAT